MKKERVIRYSILVFFIILFSVFSLRHFILGGAVAASVDALCPFGGFETLFYLIFGNGYIPGVLISSIVLAVGVLFTVVIFKKGFCGYICPFGAVQELLGKVTKKKIDVGKKWDRKLRYLKYLVLVFLIFGVFFTGKLFWKSFDPFSNFFHFGKGVFWSIESEEFILHAVGLFSTGLILLGAVFIERFWCRYLCPLASVMNIFNRFSFTGIFRNKKRCNKCRLCDRKCPVDVKVSKVDKIKDLECINCNECVNVCPKNCLDIKIFGIKFSVIQYVIFLLLVFFGIILVSKGFGMWNSVPEFEESEEFNTELIKGWMTLNDVSDATGIETQHFVEDLGLDGVSLDISIKEIGSVIGREFHALEIRNYVDNFEHSSYDIECPWGIEEDYAPGRCGLYVDKDDNGICDLSE